MNHLRQHHGPLDGRVLFRYLGGKARQARRIAALLPPHDVYTEGFGGAASVLFAKERSSVEVYNDLWGRAANLMRVVRDHRDQLADAVCLTLYSRSDYEASAELSDDPVEDARRFLVRAWQGYGVNATSHPSGFRAYFGPDKRVADEWARLPAVIRLAAERLRGVVIEETDGLDVIESADRSARRDGGIACHYIDPTYLHATRGTKRYAVEMDDADHVRLLERLPALSGYVVLSGYRSALYDDALTGWRRIEHDAYAQDATERTECLWLSPRTAAALDAASSVASRAPLPLFAAVDA